MTPHRRFNDSMNSVHLPAVFKSFARVFANAGYECHLVGGAVRNMLMGVQPGDYDVATDASPEEVMALFHRVIPTGIRHGTVTVLFKGQKIEVTTFRSEADYTDARHPDSVSFVGTIDEDLTRRDFTMNAIAMNCKDHSFADPSDGRNDIKLKIIRAIGSPADRFTEDGLRLLRACRFTSQLEFSIHPDTLRGMRANLSALRGVSSERIREELFKTLSTRRPSLAFLAMADAGILSLVLPELEICRGVGQKGVHRFDVFTHSILACDAAPRNSPEIRWAALLHDIGKPQARTVAEDGTISFHGHEERSEELAHTILQRLRTSKSFEKQVCHLIRHHMFHYEDLWSDAAVRRFLRRVGPEHVAMLITLRRADTAGTTGFVGETDPTDTSLVEFEKRIQHVRANSEAISIRDLAIDGNTLATEAGIPKNREMGIILDFLLEAVIDDPSLNEREHLLQMASRFFTERINIG